MTTSAQHLKGKVNLVTPLHYKLEGGFLWGLSGISETMIKLYFSDKTEKISVINQPYGVDFLQPDGSYFYKDYINNGFLFHDGTDMYGKEGCCLYAVADGIITRINDPIPNGTTYNPATWGFVEMNGEQNGMRFQYTYGHVSDVMVSVGQRVRTGQLIALLGNTGKYTTGPHVHVQFKEMDKSGSILNLANGGFGCLDDSMLYEDLIVYKSDGLANLYVYAKVMGDPFTYYFSWGGNDRFEMAKTKLNIIGATRSQYFDYLRKHLFS